MGRRTNVFLFFLILIGGTFPFLPGASSQETSSEETGSEIAIGNTTIAPTTIGIEPSGRTTIDKVDSSYSFHSEPVSWLAAVQRCWLAGAELAFARSPQEAQVLADLLFRQAATIRPYATLTDAVHIGVHNFLKPHWRTIDGKLLSEAGYDLWLQQGEGYCGALFADGRYYRQDCGTQLAYICQKSSPKNALAAQNYTLIPGVGRFRLHVTPRAWPLAQRHCREEGGALAVPSSARAAGLLAGALIWRGTPAQRAAGCFIGATDIAKEGVYITDDGKTLQAAGYDSWQVSEPSGNRSENCAVLKDDGLYADYPCLSPLPFCCEIPEAVSDSADSVLKDYRYQIHTQRVTWWEAVVECHKRNMTLAAPRTTSDETELRNLMSKVRKLIGDSSIMHIGIHGMNADGVWETLNGNEISFNVNHHRGYSYDNYGTTLNYYYQLQPHYNHHGSCGAMGANYYWKSDCSESNFFACEL